MRWCSRLAPVSVIGHLRKLASDCFLEDNRSHLSHRGIRSRLAEVNGKVVLLELVVTTDGTSVHITLEDLSSAA